MFTLRNSDKWSVSRIDARFGKFKQWAEYVLAAYSEESLSLKVVRNFGQERKTVEVEDGMIVGRCAQLCAFTLRTRIELNFFNLNESSN